MAVWCEQAEAEAAGGKTLNIAEYATATNTLRRLLLDLGLERRMRDITPRIDAYLARYVKTKEARRGTGLPQATNSSAATRGIAGNAALYLQNC